MGTTDTLVSLIRGHALGSPDKTALRFLGDKDEDVLALSYADIDRSARAVAARLQAAGATGERALVLHPPGPAYISALLGCFYAGVIAVPAYPPRFNRTMERLREIVVDARARFALTTASALEKFERYQDGEPGLTALRWIATDVIDEAEARSFSLPDQESDSIAFLQYTSGSTSAPKGVVLTHANVIANMGAMTEALQISTADSGVSWLPPYHDMGLIGTILLPLCMAAESTLLTPAAFLQRPSRWLQAISQYRSTINGAPNFAYELCTRRISPEQLETFDFSAWRIAFCGAERVRADTMERFARTFAPARFRHSAFTPCYGLAEATLAVSYSSIADVPHVATLGDSTLVSCGKPVSNCQVLIVDPDTGLPNADDAIGEIWVAGPSVAQGYWGKPELTAATFAARPAAGSSANPQNYLRTGDLGFMREGEIYVAGRIKDLIVLRGINYYAEDIEASIADCHPRLRLGGAAAFEVDALSEARLVIVHEIDSIRDAPLQEIAQVIRNRVAEAHEISVHEVVLLPPGGLPKTSSGKVQRSRCRELHLSGLLPALGLPEDGPDRGEHASPELVQQTASLMAELLGMKVIGATDDFFWLGGHSLLATQLVSRIREGFAVELPLRAVFEAKTPQAIAARIAAAPKLPALPPVQRVDRARELVLSFSQERMWYLHRLDPASSAYNVAGAVRMRGALNVDALRLAFDDLVRRHEVLRTNYPTIDGAPQVRIREEISLPYTFVDSSAAADPFAAATAAASALACMPFDIAAEPLIRVQLCRMGSEDHLLCASMHHMVTDAWSLGLLVTDVLKFYDAHIAGASPPAAPEEFSYVDFAQWQRRLFDDDYLRGQISYWMTQLKGAKPVDLPTDRRRGRRGTWAGAHLPLELPVELMSSLDSLAASQGTTLFMLMLAAFEVLLYRYTDSTDLVVGIPVANRHWRAAESLMGSLVNTLALRLRFNADATFAQLLRQVKETALDAFTHQDLPFDRLVSSMTVERKPGQSPIVSVMFDFQNAPMPGRQGREPRVTPVMLSRGASQFDLSLLVLDTELGRTITLEYNTELFDPATVERLAQHYQCILEAVVLRPSEPISHIPLLTRPQRMQLLTLAGQTGVAASPAQLLHLGIEAQARRAPDATAVIDRHSALSYAELDHRANVLAAQLSSLGLQRGERAAVCLHRDCQLPVALLAVLKTGAAYVPLDPNYPADRLSYVLADAAPRMLLTDTSLLASLAPPPAVTCVCLDQPHRQPSAVCATPFASNSRGRDAAYVIYTSGSTGRPKGVEVSHGALANFLRAMRRSPGMDCGDRLLSVTTIAFDIAGLELWLPLVSGGSVYLASAAAASDAGALAALIRDQSPTIMQATPSTWSMLVESGWSGDRRLKILCGGEALSADLARELLARGGSVWNMYGPTETTIWSAMHRVTDADAALIPIGKPIDETQIYILDRHREITPMGVSGEIYVGGSGVANGYFRRPDLTDERFVADGFSADPQARLYRTGDAGRMRGDGLLECGGRLDNQIKLRGFRIEPGEIETVLKQQRGIQDALVIAREDQPGNARLVAYYIPTDNSQTLYQSDLQEALRRVLPDYMIPSAFVALPAFPQTPNGKIDRKSLPPPAMGAAAPEEYVEARDDLERSLAQIWCEILGTQRSGIRDSFFAIGGHSLLAVRMFARIEKRIGIALPLSILHERPTIEYLAETLRLQLSGTTAPRTPVAAAAERFSFAVPIQRQGERPPLFCVHGAGGNVLNLSSISRHLGTDRPFVGLQAQGTDGLRQPLKSIVAMAEVYVRELRAIQPQGPYYISGYCGGGIIAFEMASMLCRAGHSVAMLTMIDCYCPGCLKTESRWRRWRRDAFGGGLGHCRAAAVAKLRRDYASLSASAKIRWHRLRGRAIPYELRDVWLTRAFLRAAANYRPAVYPGSLTLLRATHGESTLSSVGPDMGWRHVAGAGIRTLDVPGNHHTMMVEPNVSVLAGLLREILEAAQAAETAVSR